ncbi:hypothetical protein BN2475_50127 [Paraburkholderia ribeironis]|uniref:Uncharacterized protein n=1 Tax=Paraburkholderia ribeironis TaxID=1247936 RepID=A0A1N7RKJ1_9BURK|nr:hypothetical protein [Paraburkholderia ribeironis]SIT35612.1 hypothetical protein BN2475_50127 [Paraburkholderia ribeironis]
MIGIKESMKGDEDGPLSASAVEAQRWVAALTLTGLLMTILVIAGLYVATTPRNVNQACFQAKMDDEHTLLEASFQTSSDQDAIVEAMRACSR